MFLLPLVFVVGCVCPAHHPRRRRWGPRKDLTGVIILYPGFKGPWGTGLYDPSGLFHPSPPSLLFRPPFSTLVNGASPIGLTDDSHSTWLDLEGPHWGLGSVP